MSGSKTIDRPKNILQLVWGCENVSLHVPVSDTYDPLPGRAAPAISETQSIPYLIVALDLPLKWPRVRVDSIPGSRQY